MGEYNDKVKTGKTALEELLETLVEENPKTWEVKNPQNEMNLIKGDNAKRMTTEALNKMTEHISRLESNIFILFDDGRELTEAEAEFRGEFYKGVEAAWDIYSELVFYIKLFERFELSIKLKED